MREQQSKEIEVIQPNPGQFAGLHGELRTSAGWRETVTKLLEKRSGTEFIVLVTEIPLLVVALNTASQMTQLAAVILIALVGLAGLFATSKNHAKTEERGANRTIELGTL
jgi:hypothetical protein